MYQNRYDLPEAICRAIENDQYTGPKNSLDEKTISVTGLIGPACIRLLRARYAHKIVEDVSDRIWALLGSSIHSILERASGIVNSAIAEQRIDQKMYGWTVSGQCDLVEPDRDGVLTLWDYKTCKTFAVCGDRGIRPEWVAQLNIYRFLFQMDCANDDIKRLAIVAILKDWASSKIGENGYPPSAIITIDIPIWENDIAVKFIFERVKIHQAALDNVFPDGIFNAGAIEFCSPEERWAKPDVYAVKKIGGARALPGGLHSDFDSAAVFADQYSAKNVCRCEIEHRIGEDVRCKNFCNVAKFCRHGREVHGFRPCLDCGGTGERIDHSECAKCDGVGALSESGDIISHIVTTQGA